MKLLPDGGKAFYAIDWIAQFQFLICSLVVYVTVPLIPFEFSQAGKLLNMLFICVYTLYLLRKGFFPPPICVLYPDRVVLYDDRTLYWKKIELFWDQIDRFYLKEDSRRFGRYGEVKLKIKSLVVVGVTGPIELKGFDSIDKKEKEQIIQIFADHGIPQRSRNIRI